jgi:hypothetical protein
MLHLKANQLTQSMALIQRMDRFYQQVHQISQLHLEETLLMFQKEMQKMMMIQMVLTHLMEQEMMKILLMTLMMMTLKMWEVKRNLIKMMDQRETKTHGRKEEIYGDLQKI